MPEAEMNTPCIDDNADSNDNVLPIDETDIIDVSGMNFSDEDNWLYEVNQACSSSRDLDLNEFITDRHDLEELNLPKGYRRSIDTRTYTRAKRRSNRPSFESVLSNIASPIGPQKTEIFANNCSTPFAVKLKEHQEEKSSIPHMLRPNFKMYTTFLHDNNSLSQASGPESMEVFRNISQSKGADSFINMVQPEFTDVIMNESQPSMLCSSLMTTSLKDDTSLSTEILTNSMMQTSMFDDIKDVSTPFEAENLDSTIIKTERTALLKSNHNNVSIKHIDLNDISYLSLVGDETIILDNTFDSVCSDKQTNPEVDKDSFQDSGSLNNTYSKTVVELNTSLPRNECKDSPRRDTFIVRNATYDVKFVPETLNTTFEHKESSPKQDNLNQTFDAADQSTPSPKHTAMNSTFDAINDIDQEALNVTFNAVKQTELRQDLNTTFDARRESLNVTFDNVKAIEVRQIEPPKPKVVTSLRQELLSEVRRVENKCLDSTFDINSHKENYVKQTNLTLDKNRGAQNIQKGSKLMEKNHLDRKLTFTVKNNNTFVKDDDGNLNSTFLKPSDQQPIKKLQRRLPGPTIYSKAPGFLQKSNPNLISGSLNAVNLSENVSRPSLLKYPRGSQPNIASAAQKTSLGRFKSGSDQRLKDVIHTSSDFHIAASSGSTESIESTQSAHSAPDLDDRLSNCSENSSRGSYTIGRMDSDQLHKIAQLQEESLRYESTPKPNRYEGDFKKKENLPSPIAKHDENDIKEKNSVKKNDKPEFETSSPIESPVMNQTINIAGAESKPEIFPTQVQTTMKKTEVPVKRQSKLRQPTNFSTSNRPQSAASGIPRPMSRIPAPKMTRPKTAQNELKKGYL